MGRHLLTAVWSLVVLASLAAVSRRTNAWADRDYQLVSEPALASFDSKFLDLLTLGHRSLWDDYAHVRTLQYLVDPATAALDPELVHRSVMVVARHRPRIETFYMLACFILSDMKRPDLCEDIIIEGAAALPASWRLPLTEGFTAAFKLQDRAKAATYYALAASRPGAPEYIAAVSKKLATEAGLDIHDLQGTVEKLLESEGGGPSRFTEILKGVEDRRSQGGDR